jgi:hypothetical protein
MPSQKPSIFCIPAGYNIAPYALEIEAIIDITNVDIQYRIRCVTNGGTHSSYEGVIAKDITRKTYWLQALITSKNAL